MLTDSHTHLYLKAFADDREEVIKRAIDAGVTRMFLPNIDSTTIQALHNLVERYPENCFPMMGLHPTSVKKNYREELNIVREMLVQKKFIALGEIGIDLYWDKTFLKEQLEVFSIQIRWAKKQQLPIVIHARDSFQEIFQVLDELGTGNLRGVFHSFSGNEKELEKALSYDFMIGINGIVTFRNSGLEEIVKLIPMDRLLLETDAPFLAPVPFRGKRNESGFMVEIAKKVADIHNLTLVEVAVITTRNANQLFQNHNQSGS